MFAFKIVKYKKFCIMGWISMEIDVFQLIWDLEDSMTSLYKEIKSVNRFSKFSETFELMQTLSENLCIKLEKLKKQYIKPVFNRKAVIAVHNKVKDLLKKEITNDKSESIVLTKLAEGEETTGKLYKSIAFYYKKLSEFYGKISEEIGTIAKEEFDHKEALIKLQDKSLS